MDMKAKLEVWRATVREAARTADRARELLSNSQGPDAAIDAGALVSISLSLAVIADALIETMAGEIEA